MPIARHFLDWDLPVTQRVREFLLPDAPSGTVDLSDTITVVPTRHAGRQLSEALVRHCGDHGAALLSSRIVTPSFFLQAADPIAAGGLVVKATWSRLLAGIRPDDYRGLFPGEAPVDDFEWASQAGDMIERLRHTLADGAYRIADVIEHCGDELQEPERWQDLARLELAYIEAIEDLGIKDPVACRIDAAGNRELPPEVSRIVLAAVPDPSLLVVRALERLGERLDVEILVHAPASLSKRFDTWGRPVADAWAKAQLPIANSDIRVAGSPSEQSRAVVDLVEDAADRFAPDRVGLGVPDAAVTTFLEADLASAGLQAFDPADRLVRDHPVYGLLDALGGLLIDDTYPGFSRLLRHPDLLECLARDGPDTSPRRLLEELDAFQNEYLPLDFGDVRRQLATGDSYPALGSAVRFVHAHVDALGTTNVEGALRSFLKDVYAHRQLDPQEPADSEFESVAARTDAVLRELASIPFDTLGLDPPQALRLVLRRLAEESYHRVREESVLDLEGWLELPWNDAPFLIVSGMNEGIVPDGRISDVFLPDSLRKALRLRDDAQRLARDAYLLHSMVQSRRENGRVAFVVGKVTNAGDPLKPSRLLFRCPDTELPDRAALLFGPSKSRRPNTPATISFPLDSSLPDDVPVTAGTFDRLSVTAFRDYLACPYRFYLSRVLRMQSMNDDKPGMDALDFGNLVHEALHQMAESEAWRSDSEGELRAFLATVADRWVARHFGDARPLPITVALESAKQRLGAAARVQVELTREGWQIEATEQSLEAPLNGVTVIGKIDRVDRHRDTGAIRIIDYKTSDRATDPEAAHLASVPADTAPYAQVRLGKKLRRWYDLQLPLYRHLLSEHDPGAKSATVGYFNLPKAVSDTALSMWTDLADATFASAVDCAGEIVDRVRAGTFWPPSNNVRYDDFENLFFGPVEECVTEPG